MTRRGLRSVRVGHPDVVGIDERDLSLGDRRRLKQAGVGCLDGGRTDRNHRQSDRESRRDRPNPDMDAPSLIPRQSCGEESRSRSRSGRRDRVDYERDSGRQPDLASATARRSMLARAICRHSNSGNCTIMTQSDAGEEHRSPRFATESLGWVPPARHSGGSDGRCAFCSCGAGLPWLKAITPHWVIIRGGIVLLWFLLGAFILAVPAAAIGMVWSWIALVRSRRRRDRAAFVRSMKWVLLCSSCIGVLDRDGSRREVHGSPFLPDPRSAIEQEERGGQSLERDLIRPEPTVESESARRTRRRGRWLERSCSDDASHRAGPTSRSWSSANRVRRASLTNRGYRSPRLLAGSWKASFPGGRSTSMCAPGAAFASNRRCCRWTDSTTSRTRSCSSRGTTNSTRDTAGLATWRIMSRKDRRACWACKQLARSLSSTTHVIFKNLDRFYGEAPPPPHVSRELVDHPCFTPREYRYLLEEFRRRLESLAEYCNRIGALAIMIVPGSNDGAYEPSRSVLALGHFSSRKGGLRDRISGCPVERGVRPAEGDRGVPPSDRAASASSPKATIALASFLRRPANGRRPAANSSWPETGMACRFAASRTFEPSFIRSHASMDRCWSTRRRFWRK